MQSEKNHNAPQDWVEGVYTQIRWTRNSHDMPKVGGRIWAWLATTPWLLLLTHSQSWHCTDSHWQWAYSFQWRRIQFLYCRIIGIFTERFSGRKSTRPGLIMNCMMSRHYWAFSKHTTIRGETTVSVSTPGRTLCAWFFTSHFRV